jgi:hypothetical protein
MRLCKRLSLCLALPLLAACSNAAISSGGKSKSSCDADKTASKETQSRSQIFLAADTNAPATPLGGLLVFDKMLSGSYVEKGYAKAEFAADQKCSSLFEMSKRSEKYFAKFSLSQECYNGFFRLGKNQRFLVNEPGTANYIELKPVDARFEKVPKFWAALDTFPSKMRETALPLFGKNVHSVLFGFYADDYKKMTRSEIKIFDKNFCGVGELKPTPENCLRSDSSHFDEVEVAAPTDKVAALDAFVAHTELAQKASRATLAYRISPTMMTSLFSFNDKMVAIEREYLKIDAFDTSVYFIGCDPTDSTRDCAGVPREKLDTLIRGTLDLFAPEWKPRFETILGLPDRSTDDSDLLAESAQAFLEKTVVPHFVPAFDGYMELRKILSTHKDLLAIATNYVDPAGKVEGLSFKTLSPFAPVLPAELVGISLSIDPLGNVLLTHPGSTKNRNLRLDGHMGSVLTFGGVPVIPFNPISIDQSDGAALLPLPKPRKAEPSSKDAPSESKKDGTKTVGEGTSGKGC